MGICCFCCLGSCCFNSASTKQIQVTLLALNSIAFIMLFICMFVIHWKEIYSSNLYIFIVMLVMSFIYLLISILIRHWGSSGELKTTKKGTASCLSMFALVLSIIHFILCVVEEVILSISFNRAEYPCYDYDDDVSTTRVPYYRRMYDPECVLLGSDYEANVITRGEYYLSYFTFSYLEIYFMLTIFLWLILKQRIDGGLDGPVVNVVPAVTYPQAVVVIQQDYPNFQYEQNTPYIYNQQYASSNRQYNNRPNAKQ